MSCSVIYEGTAPRYAPEGSQPASKPVAPKGEGQDTTPIASAAAQQSRLVPLPVAILFRRAFIVLLLAFCEPDLNLGAAIFPVQLQRHERVALALDRAEQVTQLASIQQQLASTHGIRHDVRRRRRKRRDVGADQKRF